MKNKCHIVFGNYPKSRLLSSKELNLPEENIIDLNDDFRVGPIQNLNNDAGRAKRDAWFLSNISCSSMDPSRSQNLRKIELIKQGFNDGDLYIWSGSSALDIISFSELLYALKDFNLNIFTSDFLKIKLEREDGSFYVPDSISVVLPQHIHVIADHFKPLSQGNRNDLIYLWERLVKENALVRVLGEDCKIKSVKENYFDEALKKPCKEELQKAARVIGWTLVNINFNASDYTLNWRLKELVKKNELTFEGELKDIRDYQVKLVSAN
ncbi:DUF3658 domain-containing protein [Thalassobellus suaedae]|uniref:DUF3658 domain-containing protein n=1 Tax=Thalassobellus suaedae TaxID=3074124 RepID=A0ABY9XU26_9FLAO|nr:DUF3658 domain-containing protein [Flavobacteriaceae bacterium HL-DH14]